MGIGAHWVVEARIRREHGKFPLEWQSHEWGILSTLSPYFNKIPDRKVKTWKKKKFYSIIRKFVNCEVKIIPYSVELSETK